MLKLISVFICAGLTSVHTLAQLPGIIDSSANKKDGKGLKQGFWQERDMGGFIEGTYKDDLREGAWLMHNAAGTIIHLDSYKAGRKEGPVLSFENGYVLKEENYRDDKPDGIVRTYNFAGRIKSEALYFQGNLNGESRKYYEDGGKVQERINYTNGIKNGPSEWFEATGKPSVSFNYVNGELEGIQKTYSNGILTREENYSHGVQTGETKEYHLNGKPKSIGNYANDQKSGTWKSFDENGKLIKTEKYQNGVLK